MIYLEKGRQEEYPKCVVFYSMWTSDKMIWPNNTVGLIKGIASVANRVTQIKDPPSNPGGRQYSFQNKKLCRKVTEKVAKPSLILKQFTHDGKKVYPSATTNSPCSSVYYYEHLTALPWQL